MNINLKQNTIKKLTKILAKNYNNDTITQVEESISNFTIDYIKTNNTPNFLIEDIYNENANKIIILLEKLSSSNHIKEVLKNNPGKLSYMNDEELNPEKYEYILQKKEKQDSMNAKISSTAFKCNKCDSKKVVNTQKQTRSGDEPPSTFITCLDCGHVVKIG